MAVLLSYGPHRNVKTWNSAFVAIIGLHENEILNFILNEILPFYDVINLIKTSHSQGFDKINLTKNNYSSTIKT